MGLAPVYRVSSKPACFFYQPERGRCTAVGLKSWKKFAETGNKSIRLFLLQRNRTRTDWFLGRAGGEQSCIRGVATTRGVPGRTRNGTGDVK